MVFKKVKKNTDGTFGPTPNGQYYLPVKYHNRTAKQNIHKSKWKLKENEQYNSFELSDIENWKCNVKKGYFTILDKGKIKLGTNDEVLGFFPETINIKDAYHGFPVFSSDYEISPDLLALWKEKEVIDDRIYIKLLKCQL